MIIRLKVKDREQDHIMNIEIKIMFAMGERKLS